MPTFALPRKHRLTFFSMPTIRGLVSMGREAIEKSRKENKPIFPVRGLLGVLLVPRYGASVF